MSYSLFDNRQIDQLAENRIQQRISSDKKLEVSRRDGEKKVTQIKHKLQEEQTKSKLREEEMEALKRYWPVYMYIYMYTCIYMYILYGQKYWRSLNLAVWS